MGIAGVCSLGCCIACLDFWSLSQALDSGNMQRYLKTQVSFPARLAQQSYGLLGLSDKSALSIVGIIYQSPNKNYVNMPVIHGL